MAWIYLAESEASQSAYQNGLDLSLIAKSTPIVKEYSSIGWGTEQLYDPQSGMIYEHLVELSFQDRPLISFMEAFHARILALQAMEKAWKESEADCFSRSCAYPKKSSPLSYSLKMSQQSPLVAAFELLEKLPKWGMIVDGALYPLINLWIKKEKDGFYLPNLVACDSKKGPAKEYNRSGKQASMRNLVTISYRIWKAGALSPEVCEKIMGYPTRWTELEPWAMQWFQAKRKKRLKS